MTIQKLIPAKTCVIADFDGTIIKKVIDGKPVPALISILDDEKYLGAAGLAEKKALFAQYYPIELDHTLSPNEKSASMQEWWEKSYDIMKKYRVTSKMVTEICNSRMVQLRENAIDFLTFLHSENIPLIIYSASGIGFDAIELVLKTNHALTPNISICSNHIIFDKQGNFSHVKHPIIHSANKTGTSLVENGFISQPPERKQCLVIGDSIDDSLMSDGIAFDSVIKVAFAPAFAPKFNDVFDIVLPLEAGYESILALFNQD